MTTNEEQALQVADNRRATEVFSRIAEVLAATGESPPQPRPGKDEKTSTTTATKKGATTCRPVPKSN